MSDACARAVTSWMAPVAGMEILLRLLLVEGAVSPRGVVWAFNAFLVSALALGAITASWRDLRPAAALGVTFARLPRSGPFVIPEFENRLEVLLELVLGGGLRLGLLLGLCLGRRILRATWGKLKQRILLVVLLLNTRHSAAAPLSALTQKCVLGLRNVGAVDDARPFRKIKQPFP